MSYENKTKEEIVLENIQDKIDRLQRSVDDFRAEIRADYVTRSDFEPVRKVVYGLVSVILMGALGAVMALIFK